MCQLCLTIGAKTSSSAARPTQLDFGILAAGSSRSRRTDVKRFFLEIYLKPHTVVRSQRGLRAIEAFEVIRCCLFTIVRVTVDYLLTTIIHLAAQLSKHKLFSHLFQRHKAHVV